MKKILTSCLLITWMLASHAQTSSDSLWVTGIDTPMYEVEVIVYPNPATEEVNLELTGLVGEFDLEVYDVAGKLKHRSPLPTNTRFRLDVSKWSRGMYFLHMKNEKEVRIEKILIE